MGQAWASSGGTWVPFPLCRLLRASFPWGSRENWGTDKHLSSAGHKADVPVGGETLRGCRGDGREVLVALGAGRQAAPKGSQVVGRD